WARTATRARRSATWRPGRVSASPPSTTTSPPSWTCCASSWTRPTTWSSAASTGGWPPPTPPPRARSPRGGAPLGARPLPHDFAQLASNVAWREYTRLQPPERRAIDAKRRTLHRMVERVIVRGVAAGDFATPEPHEAARAIIILASSLVEPYGEMGPPTPEAIALYQGFARRRVRCT